MDLIGGDVLGILASTRASGYGDSSRASVAIEADAGRPDRGVTYALGRMNQAERSTERWDRKDIETRQKARR